MNKEEQSRIQEGNINVYEKGYYAVLLKEGGHREVAFFNGNVFYATGYGFIFFEEDELIIGKKLEIEWPGVEE